MTTISNNNNAAAQSSATTASLTPLQRALALAQSANATSGKSGAAATQRAMQLAKSALGAQLANALNAADNNSYGSAYSLSSSLFNTADTSSNVVDQMGSFYPAAQWQLVQNPDGITPGESKKVSHAAQLSYAQIVKTSDETSAHTPPNLGSIGTNSGRLALLGTLPANHQNSQSFTFNLQQAGQLHILAPDPNATDPTKSLGAVHLQVYDSSGTLMADSDPKSGEPYLAYVKLDQSVIAGADFHAGKYTVKLSYNQDAAANAKGDYSLFIESGTDPGRVTFYTTTDNLGQTGSGSSGKSVVA